MRPLPDLPLAMSRRVRLLLAALAALGSLLPAGPHLALAAQDAPAPTVPKGRVHIPITVVVAQPLGEFGDNVRNGAAGMSGGALFRLGSSPFAARADLGFVTYGSRTRRERLGRGALGLINVDVRTSHNIVDGALGLQVGVPGTTVAVPYVGGGVGFGYFFTESSVSGQQNTENSPFASTTNLDDGTLQPVLFGGLYIPVANGRGSVDLGVRWHRSGEVRYLTRDGISFDAAGEPVLAPRRSRGEYLSYRLGATINVW